MITITPSTRLSHVLDAFPGAVEYVVSLKPHDFQRLRNPMLRKYMSPRITLARVAAIAGISAETFMRELADRSGGAIETAPPGENQAPLPQSPETPPDWMAGVRPDAIHWVDLIPIDAVSGDPIPPINTAVRRMAPGSVLGIRHRWEPQPLYDLWQKMGIEWYSRSTAGDTWEVFVHKPSDRPAPDPNESVMVDLRHLPPAEGPPRVSAMFEQLPPGHSVEIWAQEGSLAPVREFLDARHPGEFDWSEEPGAPGKQVVRVTVREGQ